MEELVLHQAGQRRELGDVAPQKIALVHHAQDASHLPLAAEDGDEGFAGGARVTIGSVHQLQAAADQSHQFRREDGPALLGVLEGADHAERVVLENLARFGVEPAIE